MIFFVGNTVKLPPWIINTRGKVAAITTHETVNGHEMSLLIAIEVPREGTKFIALPAGDVELVTKEQLEREQVTEVTA